MSKAGASLVSLLLASAPAVPVGALEDKRLDWGRDDTNWHMGVAFGAGLLGTELLKWRGWPLWKATAASSLAVAAGGAVKEFLIDDFASGNDLMADGVGLGANVLVQFTVHFGWTARSGETKAYLSNIPSK